MNVRPTRRGGERSGGGSAALEHELPLLAAALGARLEGVLAAGVEGLAREIKRGAFDTVTQADRAMENWLAAWVHERFPTHGFLGEEEGWRWGPTGGVDWVVDPIDGTENFANGIPWACSSVGILLAGVPHAGLIVDPFRHDAYLTTSRFEGTTLNGEAVRLRTGAVAGTVVALEVPSGVPFNVLGNVAEFVIEAGGSARVMGSGALALALLAAGRVQGVLHAAPNSWDVAAGVALVEGAGGVVLGADGPYVLGSSGALIAGSPEVASALQAALGGAVPAEG